MAARRIHLDIRLIIGAVLVLASVLGVVWVVSAANQTVTVLVASRALAAGETLTAEHVRVIEVPQSDVQSLYLGELPETAAVLTRPVGENELVPLSALGVADDAFAQVVITVSGGVPESVRPGSMVELWSAAPSGDLGRYEAPVVLVGEAQVARLLESDRLVGGGQIELELRIPDAEVASVLAAVTGGALLQVVPIYTDLGA